LLWLVCTSLPAASYEGVDKTVVEKLATDAGRPPQKPLIDPDQGDLGLFLFLTAGAVGGFVAGYAFRGLFPPKKKN
jgi:ABC-type cobalt transport system substrate-binding protein